MAKIQLPDAGAEIEPVPTTGGGRKPEPELDRLSNIIKAFNNQFGSIPWTDSDRVHKLIAKDIPERFGADTAYQNARQNSNSYRVTGQVSALVEHPLIEVGVMELNRNPESFFAEVEQAAFNPANVVPGIGFSPDKMLQGRLFSYGDAQRYRLGVNHHLIPVNAARCPVHSYHRDGAMRVDGNHGGTLAYEPNS